MSCRGNRSKSFSIPETGELEVLVIRRVVEEVEDADREIELTEALELDDSVEVGMEMEFPVDPEQFTRIAVADDQTGHYPEDPARPNGPSSSRSIRIALARF